jgi:2-keto-4-pentenoate hydratase/2-oxohepta-3-ene-1,7-dioic acid hydratase in catechol pathway
MATNLIRYAHGDAIRWGVSVGDRIAPLAGNYRTTADLIAHGESDWRTAATSRPVLRVDEVELLSPVTTPCRVLCQGANYRQHMIESGLNPDEKVFNMFFEKADCSVSPPRGSITRPAHVMLLDYEIELALVFRRAITGPVTVSAENMHEYVFGITIANDVSARDVQIPQMQFFKGKSYRGFCPLGPHLAVLEREDFAYLDQLALTLAVNGQVHQHDETKNLVYKPAETITELSTFSDLSPGDVLLTGTPSGCALTIPPPLVRKAMQLLMPERKFWAMFRKMQGRRPQYLQPGDVMTATIASADRVVDLGEQRVRIADASERLTLRIEQRPVVRTLERETVEEAL